MLTKPRKAPKNKRTKFTLVFDEKNRRDYLKNFKKRKDERKLKAQEQFKKDVKEERKKYKLEQKEKLQEMFASQRTVPEVEHLVDPVKYELPSHTVTISSIENVDLAGHNDLHLGRNIITESPALNKGKNPLLKCKNVEDIKKVVKKNHQKKMKSSKNFNSTKKIQSKKDRQTAKKNRRQNMGKQKVKKRNK